MLSVSGVLCKGFKVTLPKTAVALKGSCVTISCSFDIDNQFEQDLDATCRGIWIRRSSGGKIPSAKVAKTGDLKRKDCTTTFNNVDLYHNNNYYFRLQCASLQWTFSDASVKIQVTGRFLFSFTHKLFCQEEEEEAF